MILRRSRYVHQLPLGDNRILIVHAVSHMRLPADREVDRLLAYFAEPRAVADAIADLQKIIPYSAAQIEAAIKGLVARKVLTDRTPEQEQSAIAAELAPTHGRDPGELLERFRREMKEGAQPYWAATSAQGVAEIAGSGKRVDALLFGDCDIQMEADFLRREAASRGIDLHVAATFADDVRFAEEHKHEVIFIGALRARHAMMDDAPVPHAAYLAQARQLLTQLRGKSPAPILIDNLPEPTVQPLGLAERGPRGHRNRFRIANLALSELADDMPDTHIVDIAAALAAEGSATLLDDGLSGFTHFGSPGWLLQRPEYEKKAVHDIFPDLSPLVHRVGGDPYLREKITARAHIDALAATLGIGRKKCVILDLDGTLWPGVLAETGSPFAWTPEISGAFSYIGLYFGLHEALLCLKKRGVVLACVSKNDEKTVRDLWAYPDTYPRSRLLTPDDFVTWRVNWNDKVDNIRSIAEELGFALDSFIFIDDHPVERDRVRQRLPEVDVWGEDPFALRRRLLSDPRLQLPVITEEASSRSALVKAQLERRHSKEAAMDEASYLASLDIKCDFIREAPDSPRLQRVEELFQRTTQFNATGRKFPGGALRDIAARGHIFTMDVSDRFGAYGLVGAAVIEGAEITGIAVSCRALGMGVEHRFIKYILAQAGVLQGRIVETPRNIPVRNIYKDNGFTEIEAGLWGSGK